MRRTVKLAAAVLTTAALAGGNATTASAGDQFSFPGSNGIAVAASSPHFAPSPQVAAAQAQASATLTVGGLAKVGEKVPVPLYVPVPSRVGAPSPGVEPYAYHFFTHALASQAFSNYAADYYRLFAPNYAVTAWTDRVSGLVDAGYGGAVDSWTAGTYYLGRVRGPSGRRNSPPDLSKMPVFSPHPELETHPTFENN